MSYKNISYDKRYHISYHIFDTQNGYIVFFSFDNMAFLCLNICYEALGKYIPEKLLQYLSTVYVYHHGATSS